MSTTRTMRIIEREIERLNQVIDMKIIRGLSYKQEAKRHKFLMSQLAQLQRVNLLRPSPRVRQGSYRSQSWLTRSLRLASTFIF